MKHFSAIWSDKLGEAIKAECRKACIKSYPIECHSGSDDLGSLIDATSQGIDSHLEAIFFTQGKGSNGRMLLTFEAKSVPVLVRRLLESEDDNAHCLASSICSTLGIELI